MSKKTTLASMVAAAAVLGIGGTVTGRRFREYEPEPQDPWQGKHSEPSEDMLHVDYSDIEMRALVALPPGKAMSDFVMGAGLAATQALMSGLDMRDSGEVVSKTADMGKSEISERRYKALDPRPDGFPDRLCIEAASKYFSSSCVYVGVKIAGVESNDVVEYCISGRWVRVGLRGEDGKLKRLPKNMRLFDTTTKSDVDIEPFWRQTPSRQVKRALRRVGAK